MKPSEVLREAVKLPWSQGSLAKNKLGQNVDSLSHDACSFCALGRLDKIKNDYTTQSEIYYLKQILDILDKEGHLVIANWNDAPERTQAEVDEVFLKAAELAESEGE